ncbi:unnamed protein product, partial [Sphacelaria rigidula]
PPTYPRKAQQQLQSHLAAAAAMNQYAASGYGRGLPEQMDPYHAQHIQQPYHPQMEIPRAYMLSTAPASGPYLAAGPQLGYYGHQYPGMMQHIASMGGSESSQHLSNAAKAPEPAPPPALTSSTSPLNQPQKKQQKRGEQQQPKESILSSLLAARSERLAAAVEDGESSQGAADAAAAAAGSQTGSGMLRRLGDAAADTSETKGPVASPVPPTTLGKAHLQEPTMASSPHAGPEPTPGSAGASGTGTGGLGATAAAAFSAATAMHLTGMRGQFAPAPAFHQHPMGGMSGASPPLPTAMAMQGGPHGGPAQAPVPPGSVMATAPPPQSMAFSSHDAFEEHMRQQEKKLQKRAANRKSAQLSRKRKKALIEDLKYENQDLQRHEDILEVIPDPVFAFDTASGGVWFASNSASAQVGLSVEDLTSACFFDLMTEDCSKRLRVLIEHASKDMSETGSSVLHERMTVRFKKRKAAIVLGELSGRLSHQGDGIMAVCSVRPLSVATDDLVGKGYYGDASVSELAEETSDNQGSSGEDSRSGTTGVTSGSTADSSSGVGTGCTSIADEGSSSVPSLSSLEVKSDRGASGGTSDDIKVQGRSGGGGGGGGSSSRSS